MQTHTLCFSPTQTGATIVQAIQSGMDAPMGRHFDLTLHAPERGEPFNQEDLLIVGMPVYAGRLPAVAVDRFKSIRGKKTPVVAVVLYGNRAYEDALVELVDLCTEQGFQVIAAAAFIGEHSYSSRKHPIAAHRPDSSDLKQATELGARVQQRLDLNRPLTAPNVPGNRPYKPRMDPVGSAAETNLRNCVRCGLCETFCPTNAITLTDAGPQTKAEDCIWCAACVKVCTSHARDITLPFIKEITEQLHSTCQTRKEPEWFLAS
jgi:ferredoxin